MSRVSGKSPPRNAYGSEALAMIYITISFKRTYRQALLVMPVFRELQEAWHPGKLVERCFQDYPKKTAENERAVFLGKCAIPMAEGFSRLFPEMPKLVHSTKPSRDARRIRNAELLWGTHPGQSKVNLENSLMMKEWLKRTEGNLIAFVSGGASALLSSPPPGWTLREIVRIEKTLLSAGAPIEKINAVRISLSTLKAGGMAELVKPYSVRSFVWCDVPLGKFRITGSAPFWKYPGGLKTSPAKILREYEIAAPGPLTGKPPFRAVPGSNVFKLADGSMMASDFVGRLKERRIRARKVAIPEGTRAEEAASLIAEVVSKSPRPCVLVGNGEYPVEVKGRGKGGRCSHLAALVARELRDRGRWFFAAVATDGEDGAGGAGAFVCDESLPPMKELNEAIRKSDTAALFEKYGGLIPRSSTGNNLRDLWFLSLEEDL